MRAGCLCLHTYTSRPVAGSKIPLPIPLELAPECSADKILAIAPLLRHCTHFYTGFGKAVLDVACCHGMTHLENLHF